jgi:hypothetical protein
VLSVVILKPGLQFFGFRRLRVHRFGAVLIRFAFAGDIGLFPFPSPRVFRSVDGRLQASDESRNTQSPDPLIQV